MPGHWEGDLIKGLGTSRLSGVGRVQQPYGALVQNARYQRRICSSGFYGQAQSDCKTLTYDQGKEMAYHRELARHTNIKVYFCDQHSPWQRGSCENTNGLLRQFLSKKAQTYPYTTKMRSIRLRT